MAAKKIKVDKVINQLGNTVYIITKGTTTYDDYGEPITSGDTEVETLGVNYNYFAYDMNFTQFGRLNDGESELMLKADEIITNDSLIKIDGKIFNIMSIYPIKSGNVLIAYQLRLSEGNK